LIRRAEADEAFDVEAELMKLGPDERLLLESRVADRMAPYPAPIGPRVDGPDVRRYRALHRLRAWAAALRGDPDALLAASREEWLRGADHATYLRTLVRFGRARSAVHLASVLLDRPGAENREGLEGVLAEAAHAPDRWREAVAELAAEPSDERWRALFLFTPPEHRQERLRYTIRLLLALGTSAEAIFDFVALDDTPLDTVEIVDKGMVASARIEARAKREPSHRQAPWFGLAARAACVRGDRLGSVRLLREAIRAAGSPTVVDADVRFVRSRADAMLRQMLDGAGL
jgi:hypothetical protein